MQDALRHTKASHRDLDGQRELDANAPSAHTIGVQVSTSRASVARRLVRLLGNAAGIEILSGSDPEPAVSQVHSGRPPAVLVLDCGALSPQERLRLQHTARTLQPARVLWLLDAAPSGDDAVRLLLDGVKAGWCHGFVLRKCPAETLVRAVTAVGRLDVWLPRALLLRAFCESENLRAGVALGGVATQVRNRVRTLLTLREREILRLVRCGLTNKEAGSRLGIKEDTVKKHLRNMYAKLGVHRRVQLFRSSAEPPASR